MSLNSAAYHPIKQQRFIKRISLLFLVFIITLQSRAQYNNETIKVLTKLDSIRNSGSISRHFAGIYSAVVFSAVPYFSKADTSLQCLMDRLEKRFAGYFLRSVAAYENKTTIPDEWKAYYDNTGAPALRYILYGINAHINGDIWQALTTEFSAEEITRLKHCYNEYNKQLLKNYNDIYAKALASSNKIKFLHTITFGFDRAYGKMLLTRWRKRQLKLAELYYTNKPLFEKKLRKVQRKMKHVDMLISKHIK